MVDWSGRLGLDNKAPTPSVWILSTFGEEEGYSVRKCGLLIYEWADGLLKCITMI